MSDQPRVSVVMAARDAEATLDHALDSMRAQTERSWETIIVDDGSTDATAELAARAADDDDRIRVLFRPAAGVSAARNAGLAAGRAPWAMFLDADDWLEPGALATLGDALAADPALDAAYGAWTRVTEQGRAREQTVWPAPDALFAVLACRSVLPINSVMFRRALVDAVGGFDVELETAEDWDFWQRLARAGVRFAMVPEPVAGYRFRRESASNDPERLLAGAVEVIRRGHRADSRVRSPHPEHATGRRVEGVSPAVLMIACWCAGLAIGRGEGATHLLEAVPQDDVVDLEPRAAGDALVDALTLVGDDPLAALDGEGGLDRRLLAFLEAAQVRTRAPGWSARARRAAEDGILARAAARPLRAGGALAMSVELTEPLADVTPIRAVERLHCDVALEGDSLGNVVLPVCDGVVPGRVIADAAAAAFFWEVLGRFFSRTVYPDLLVQAGGGHALRRGELELAAALTGRREDALAQAHERAGWTVFLQELWGRPEWPEERFYELGEPQPGQAARTLDGWVVVEASVDGADVRVEGGEVQAVVTIGGVPVCRTTVAASGRARITAGELRAALTVAGGLELCRVAVREALLGRPLGAPGSLRERLGRAAALRASEPRTPDAAPWAAQAGAAPGWDAVVAEAGTGEVPTMLLARHAGPPRRAALPAAAADALLRGARAACEPALVFPAGTRPLRVFYVPELLWRPGGSAAPNAATDGREVEPEVASESPDAFEPRAAAKPRHYDRHVFEALFAGRADPWRYDTPYEQGKYDQTLAMLPSGRIDRVLEIGCAEGHFTARLAPRVGELVAVDISSVALERAAQRCRGLANVAFELLDLAEDPLPGRFDAIVVSEVLYYVGDLAACAARLAGALRPNGHLVAAHGNVLSDDPAGPGFAWDVAFGARTIGEVLSATPGLSLVGELRTPYYRIHLLQRDRTAEKLRRRRSPGIIDSAARAAPRPAVASAFRPGGGEAPVAAQAIPVTTARLPILMYHRVADAGPDRLARCRVTPRAFDEQIGYLRSVGFQGVSLADWGRAAAARRPFAGRAVTITFDDGYLDFLTDAWPILRRHGFTADVFLITDAVGGTSTWDRRYGQPAQLLGWEHVAALEAEGARFGSHTAAHRPLAALAPHEVVEECARSRAVLHERLRERPTAIAYPGRDVDPAIAHLAGACGFEFGLTCEPEAARLSGDPLLLPRIEVGGSLTLAGFVARLAD